VGTRRSNSAIGAAARQDTMLIYIEKMRVILYNTIQYYRILYLFVL